MGFRGFLMGLGRGAPTWIWWLEQGWFRVVVRSFGLRVEGWLFAGQISGVEERGFEGRFRRIPA